MRANHKHLHNQVANHLIKIVVGLLLTFMLTLIIESQAGHLFESVPFFFQSQAQTLGLLSLLLFIVFYILANFLLIPTTPFIFIAGLTYSFPVALVLMVVATSLAASIDFLLARRINARLPLHMLHTKKIEKFKQHINKHGFNLILLLRYIGIHFSVVSYAAGITKIRYKKFISATALGFLPYTLIYLYAGSVLTKLGSISFIYWLLALKVVLIITFIILYLFVQKKHKL